MKRIFLSLAVIFTIALGIWMTWEPRDWHQQLAKSSTLTLYSLEPERSYWPANTPKSALIIDGSLILGSTTITDANEKALILAAMDKKMNGNSDCEFSPRHALESADKRIRIVACFECGQGFAETGADYREVLSLSPKAAPIINTILRKHGVPLSHLGRQEMP